MKKKKLHHLRKISQTFYTTFPPIVCTLTGEWSPPTLGCSSSSGSKLISPHWYKEILWDHICILVSYSPFLAGFWLCVSTSAPPCYLFLTHLTSSESCSASEAPSGMIQSPLQKFSSWPRHLRADLHFWEERSKINLLWTRGYVLPSQNSGQFCLCCFICTHTGAINNIYMMIMI